MRALTDGQLRAQWEELREATHVEPDWLERTIMERQLERLEREAVRRFCREYVIPAIS